MDKVTILYIIWSLRLGGAERVVTDLAKNSDRKLFSPFVCCLNDKGDYAQEIEEKGIKVIPLNKRHKFDPIIIFKIYKIIKHYKIRIVNTHLWTANFWGRIAAFLAGVKAIVATEHTTDEKRPEFYHFADRILAHLTECIIAVSTSVREFHQKRSKIPSKKFSVINNGIDTKAFDIQIDTEEKRKEFGLHSDDFVIGLFGRFVPAKAHEILLEALKDVIIKHSEVKVLFAGSGPTENKIKELTHELNLENNVIFAGFRKDTPELYKIIDLFVLCSNREGFPITLLEAMAAGVPAIVTDVGGNVDIIQNMVNGILIKPGSSSILSKKMNEIIENAALRYQLARKAKEIVMDKFTSQMMTAHTERLFVRLIYPEDVHKKIRLLLVIDHLDSGGAQRQIIELARRLPRQKYDIVVCNLDGNRKTLQPEIEQENIPVFSVNQYGFIDMKALLKLFSYIRTNHFDIVHTYLFTADTYGRIAAILASTPVVIASMRSVDNWKNLLHKLTDKILAAGTDKIIVNAKEIQKFLQSVEKIPHRKIRVIYNGIDENLFELKVNSEKIRAGLGLKKEDLLVGIFARNDPVKDHKTFFQAAKIISHNFSNVTFLAMGYGMTNTFMKEIVQKFGIEDKVILKDHSPRYLSYLASVDISIISSLIEGCSNVILESMALKKPVIATDVGGNPELVINGQTGLLVPPQNPEKLAEAIMNLINDTQKRASFGKAGKDRVIKYFSMDKMVKNTMVLYDNILSEKLYKNV